MMKSILTMVVSVLFCLFVSGVAYAVDNVCTVTTYDYDNGVYVDTVCLTSTDDTAIADIVTATIPRVAFLQLHQLQYWGGGGIDVAALSDLTITNANTGDVLANGGADFANGSTTTIINPDVIIGPGTLSFIVNQEGATGVLNATFTIRSWYKRSW